MTQKQQQWKNHPNNPANQPFNIFKKKEKKTDEAK